jgi:hypothetical protein
MGLVSVSWGLLLVVMWLLVSDMLIYDYVLDVCVICTLYVLYQGVSMSLERPFVYVFKFPFHTNVFMLKLSSIYIKQVAMGNYKLLKS